MYPRTILLQPVCFFLLVCPPSARPLGFMSGCAHAGISLAVSFTLSTLFSSSYIHSTSTFRFSTFYLFCLLFATSHRSLPPNLSLSNFVFFFLFLNNSSGPSKNVHSRHHPLLLAGNTCAEYMRRSCHSLPTHAAKQNFFTHAFDDGK